MYTSHVLSRDELKSMYSMIESGVSYEKIGKSFCVTAQAIGYHAKKIGHKRQMFTHNKRAGIKVSDLIIAEMVRMSANNSIRAIARKLQCSPSTVSVRLKEVINKAG
jgi:predicted transcriptional regulator